LIQKGLDVAWDMREQRNDIKHNTPHPRCAAEVLDVKVQLQLLHREEGRKAFFHKTACSSRNRKQHCSKEIQSEMLQWITSVLNAK
jgi:hypothetical protein